MVAALPVQVAKGGRMRLRHAGGVGGEVRGKEPKGGEAALRRCGGAEASADPFAPKSHGPMNNK